MSDIKITRSPTPDTILIGEYEPGNGTNYKAIAAPWYSSDYMNALGCVSDGWLVISCNTARAYLFQYHGYLVDDYIREKLGGSQGDYPYFGDLVRKLLQRE